MTDSTYPEHIVVYDGVCRLCNKWVNFILAADPNETFYFCAAQSELGERLMASADVGRNGGSQTDYQSILLVRGLSCGVPSIVQKSDAVLAIFAKLKWPYRIVSLCKVVPTSWRNWGYDFVVKNRYRWLGQYHCCPLPKPGFDSRFLD